MPRPHLQARTAPSSHLAPAAAAVAAQAAAAAARHYLQRPSVGGSPLLLRLLLLVAQERAVGREGPPGPAASSASKRGWRRCCCPGLELQLQHACVGAAGQATASRTQRCRPGQRRSGGAQQRGHVWLFPLSTALITGCAEWQRWARCRLVQAPPAVPCSCSSCFRRATARLLSSKSSSSVSRLIGKRRSSAGLLCLTICCRARTTLFVCPPFRAHHMEAAPEPEPQRFSAARAAASTDPANPPSTSGGGGGTGGEVVAAAPRPAVVRRIIGQQVGCELGQHSASDDKFKPGQAEQDRRESPPPAFARRRVQLLRQCQLSAAAAPPQHIPHRCPPTSCTTLH